MTELTQCQKDARKSKEPAGTFRRYYPYAFPIESSFNFQSIGRLVEQGRWQSCFFGWRGLFRSQSKDGQFWKLQWFFERYRRVERDLEKAAGEFV